jgi:hypothetical protein
MVHLLYLRKSHEGDFSVQPECCAHILGRLLKIDRCSRFNSVVLSIGSCILDLQDDKLVDNVAMLILTIQSMGIDNLCLSSCILACAPFSVEKTAIALLDVYFVTALCCAKKKTLYQR